MKTHRFDEISRMFARRKLSRRQVLAASGAAGLAATGAGQVAAQDATPETAAPEKVAYLFVQSFQSGSIAPAEDAEGRYTVTLEQGLACRSVPRSPGFEQLRIGPHGFRA